MSQKLPINGFKWVTYLSRFNENFIKSYNENSDKRYFLEVDAEYPKNYLALIFTIFTIKKKIRKSRKACLCYRRQRKIRHSHKSFKTSNKSWINTKRST